MCEMNLLITENLSDAYHLKYIARTVEGELKKLGGDLALDKSSDRAYLSFGLPKISYPVFEAILKERIAEIITVSYKYSFFKKYLRTGGISDGEYEMLLAALIAADLEEDKRYVKYKTVFDGQFSIDGFFNFRLGPLKDKWTEIVGYIPPFFSPQRLGEFISFIVGEKSGRRATVVDGGVYDARHNRISLSSLLSPMDGGEGAREVLLSGFGEVELASPVSKTDERYLVRFYGDKIFFTKPVNPIKNR